MTPTLLSPILEDDFFAARCGDRDAFGRLVAATQRTVASIALAVTRDIPLSEDIAQEIYLTAWQRLATLQHPESLLPWLRQVTRNRALDHVRRRRHEALAPGDAEVRLAGLAHGGPSPEAGLLDGQQSELLARALDEIPDESREVLVLFYREGQSSRHVAALLGLSDGAVRKRLQRAREVLQAELLAQAGEVARYSAPGLAFATLVVASLGPFDAGAATVATGTGTATASKWVLGTLGSALGALAIVLGAVFWDVRHALRHARNPVERRELLRHGLLYAGLMASFVGVLLWSRHAQWTLATLLAVSAGFSVAIIGLGVRRARIHRRHRPSR
jgi:RNA polymerase sigma factor (sigma-70 family)